jgi:hypothetical protein
VLLGEGGEGEKVVTGVAHHLLGSEGCCGRYQTLGTFSVQPQGSSMFPPLDQAIGRPRQCRRVSEAIFDLAQPPQKSPPLA